MHVVACVMASFLLVAEKHSPAWMDVPVSFTHLCISGV